MKLKLKVFAAATGTFAQYKSHFEVSIYLKMASALKGNRVKLSTFKNWNTGGYINCETTSENGTEYVCRVWCKICSAHAQSLRNDSCVRGKAKSDLDLYAMGTNFVKRCSVFRHLSSKSHLSALQYEKSITPDDQEGDIDDIERFRPLDHASSNIKSGAPFQNIKSAILSSSKDAYKKLMTNAYLLAVDGQPLTCFKTIVTAQKSAGVRLITGTDSPKAAREFINTIASTIQQKIKDLLCSVKAFSLLSDGSQARKTGSEKELVLVRILKDGKPVYFLIALQDIDEYGDPTAEHIKDAIDDAFRKKINMDPSLYTSLMVSATADGASVNMGAYRGVLARLTNDDRPWLLSVHCVSHRCELSIKDSINKEKMFDGVFEMMQNLHQFFKQSGKFKGHFNKTSSVLGCQSYDFPKVQGTRFISHQYRAIDHLLKNWVILLQTLENSIANQSFSKVNAKLIGFRKKLQNMEFLSKCIVFRSVVQRLSILSKKFEQEGLLVCDIKPAVERTINSLSDLLDEPVDAASQLALAEMTFDSESNILSCRVPKRGHMKRKVSNREYVSLNYSGITHTDGSIPTMTNSAALKHRIVPVIKQCLRDRFKLELEDEDDIYRQMRILTNPANWTSSHRETRALTEIGTRFMATLSNGESSFDPSKLASEWNDLKLIVKHNYLSVKARKLWPKIFLYRKREIPNVCAVIELLLCIGLSNSTVERGFSSLTSMLSDRRLSLHHKTMENLLLIRVNNLSWTDTEREDILNRSVNAYLSKRRKCKMESANCSTGSSLLGALGRKRNLSESESDSESEPNDNSDSNSSMSGTDTDTDYDSDHSE